MRRNSQVSIPAKAALSLVFGYAKTRLVEQIQSVSFILIYLVIFQRFILNIPFSQSLAIALGIVMVIFGLTFFLEGVKLGLMPLGEQVGVRLPEKYKNLLVIMVFGFLVGFGSTIAEPSIAALRELGSTVPVWKSPLLYYVLERHTEELIYAIGIGVGAAVIIGLTRFYYDFSIKPLIFIIIPIVLGFTLWAHYDEKLNSLIGLAWDSGAVTTGAVSVPMILAIGIGVSRASGKKESLRGGFGVIMLASALPIIAVLSLGLLLSPSVPAPSSEEDFFSQENRDESLRVFKDEAGLRSYVFRMGSEKGRRAYFESNAEYLSALRYFASSPTYRHSLLASMSFADWITARASDYERSLISRYRGEETGGREKPQVIGEVMEKSTGNAVQAIVPLTGLLLLVLLLFLRERPQYSDELVLGIFLAIIGMTLLTAGISLGLSPLGREVGQGLPRSFQNEEKELDRVIIRNFDPDLVVETIHLDGSKSRYFLLEEGDEIRRIRFDPKLYDAEEGTYEHIITRDPMFGPGLSLLGLILVFVFAFGLGYGSSLAEPALHALGQTVESLTIGTVREHHLVRIVAIGVGLGIMIGVVRIVFSIPTVWLLLPPYLLLLPMSLLGEENFVGIAWDSGGVTTGSVTVPLVLAMGLGIGEQLSVHDSFGILALGSVYPIFTVLAYSLFLRVKNEKHITANNEGETHD